jgi:2,6-dihydroxypseudooxynicotine hydrolase
MTTRSGATADPQLAAALAHWAPRLVANGIDYNDFVATTARVERWADWCAAWMETGAIHERLAAEADERGASASAAEARVRAALCHHFGKFVFFEDMDAYRMANARTVANFRAALPHLDPPAERVEIPYAGTVLPGYLRLPKGSVDRPPVVLIISGLDSVKEEMHTFEPLFHRRGMATLSFDGPGQGESEALPIEPAFEKPVAAVADWIARRGDVDGRRVGAVGVSLGGYYAARAAAYVDRLACAVSVGGPYDISEVFASTPTVTQQAFMTRSHSPTLAAAAEAVRALTLKDAARRIERPFLVVFGQKDRLIPFAQAERLISEVPFHDKQLVLYPEGNHVCNNMPYAYRPMVADWVAARLGAEAVR